MTAIYAIAYECDYCGAEDVVLRRDGNTPSMRRDLPPGWRKTTHRGSCRLSGGVTGPSTVWQLPTVCPSCVPVIEQWEAADDAWMERRKVVAIRGPAVKLHGWLSTNPRPVFPFGGGE